MQHHFRSHLPWAWYVKEQSVSTTMQGLREATGLDVTLLHTDYAADVVLNEFFLSRLRSWRMVLKRVYLP